MPSFEKYCEVIFWDFKRMDNVIYNFDMLARLIEDADKSKNEVYYYKSIVILMISIIECTLYDFLCRIQEERWEGINLSDKEKNIIRQKNLPKQLKNYIDICKKHALLGEKSANIYDGLYKYLDIRNRVHIQNLKRHDPTREWKLWSNKIVNSCGRLLKDTFIYICKKYPRPENFHSNPDLSKFPTPWVSL